MPQLPNNIFFRYENKEDTPYLSENIPEILTFSTPIKETESIPFDLNMCIDVGPIQLKLKYATVASITFAVVFFILVIIISIMNRKIRYYQRRQERTQEMVPIYRGQDNEEENVHNLTSFANPYSKLASLSANTAFTRQTLANTSAHLPASTSDQSESFSSSILNNTDLIKCIAEMWPFTTNPVTTVTKLKEIQTARSKRLKEYHGLEVMLFHRKKNEEV